MIDIESDNEMMRILKPNGLLFINAPANGHFHRHESDNWRFYPDDAGESLSKWGCTKVITVFY